MSIDLEAEIADEMCKPFSSGGYKISNGHFDIGRKLHCEDYYFIKNFFQKRENCTKVAQLLGKKLDKINSNSKTTLIGFGNYSAMLLAIFCENNAQYNYAILENEGNSYAFQLEPKLSDNIIIVLPVICSGATYFKLKRYIDSYVSAHELKKEGIKKKAVKKEFLNVFTIVDKELADFVTDDLKSIALLPSLAKQKLYESLGWNKVSRAEIHFEVGQVKAFSLILLQNTLHLPENCVKCFPEISGQNQTEEKFLFSTNVNFGTPNLIFNLPNFNFSANETVSFNDAMGFNSKRPNPHLFGSIQVNNNSYQNFVQGNIFYDNNRDAIIKFFSQRLSERLNEKDEVVFVSHDTKYSSLFLEDISRSEVLKERKVTILRYQPSYEFVDNFITVYSKIFNENTKIIYFEDVLSGAWTFKITSDYLKYSKQDKSKKTGFYIVLTLVDRTSNFTKDEILRKLSKGEADERDIIPFFKLNVPIFGNVQLEDPLKEKYNMLRQLIKECHLDALKMIVNDDIEGYRPKKLKEIILESKTKHNRLYIPLPNIRREVWIFYSRYFNEETLNYIRLFLTHKIYTELSAADDSNSDLIDKLFSKLPSPLDMLLSSKEKDKFKSARLPEFERIITQSIIISILTKPPFTYYEEIYKAVFNYCVTNLENCDPQTPNVEANKINADQFINFKTAIKRSIDVNSNYIISKRFLENLKIAYEHEQVNNQSLKYRMKYLAIDSGSEEFDKILQTNIRHKYKELVSYNYFLLYSFKKLLFKNPGRSIRLEELLNHDDLTPKPSQYKDKKEVLIKLWRSSYHLFHRILKAENISILKDLKDFHVEKKKSIGDNHPHIYGVSAKINRLKKFYFSGTKNDNIILNARNFVAKSISVKIEEIQRSTCSMLRLLNIITTVNKNLSINHHNAKGGQIKLNQDARLILDEVINIFQAGKKRDNLNYAFFIEYIEPNNSESNLYPILSSNSTDSNEDDLSIKLDKSGFIHQALNGLVDTFDSTNPQTLLFAGKFEDGSVYSFQDEYFNDYKHASSTKNRQADYLSVQETELENSRLKFSELYERDYYRDDTQTGLKILKKSNMTLFFRLSSLIETNPNQNASKLKGQAVLVITNTDETTVENYLNFMNIEKIRLLLLIKEDLLAYLQRLFDNDAFREVLENKKQAMYQSKLEHGINRYLEAQHSMFNQMQISKNEEEIERNKILFNIIKRAIKAQIKFKENIGNTADENLDINFKPVDVGEILTVIRYIFESGDLGNDPIPFNSINCRGFVKDNTISMDESVLYIVIPEIIINMKKYSSRLIDDGLEITFSKEDNKLIFKNDIIPAKKGKSMVKNRGGVEMCRKIMETLKYKDFVNRINIEQNTYTAILNLNKKMHGS